jgi:hypothetical protein
MAISVSASASVSGGTAQVEPWHELIRAASSGFRRRSKIEHENNNDFGPSGQLTLTLTLPVPRPLPKRVRYRMVPGFDQL